MRRKSAITSRHACSVIWEKRPWVEYDQYVQCWWWNVWNRIISLLLQYVVKLYPTLTLPSPLCHQVDQIINYSCIHFFKLKIKINTVNEASWSEGWVRSISKTNHRREPTLNKTHGYLRNVKSKESKNIVGGTCQIHESLVYLTTQKKNYPISNSVER